MRESSERDKIFFFVATNILESDTPDYLEHSNISQENTKKVEAFSRVTSKIGGWSEEG